MGAIPINFTRGDPVEQIFKYRKENRGIQQSLRPGEEKIQGVDCAIDAVGYQARADNDPERESPMQVLENCIKIVNATGSVGVIGVYTAPDPGGKDGPAKKGIYPFPIADFFDKGIAMGSGQAPVKKYNEYLRDLIVNGKAQPSRIVSHRIPIDKAPEAYEKFDKRIEGYTKILIKFEEMVAA